MDFFAGGKMTFSEKTKLDVKRRAAFRCCRCQNVGIDVHHIIPESEGGPDDISNAAPLCQNCHDRFGDNPQKRKEIIQMRDWWYEVCSRKFGKQEEQSEYLERINNQLVSISTGQ
jgi:5-methylcytosine-specific restriction endonuclease McrA